MKNHKARWIWYPGDFEIWLGNRFNNRRTERGAVFPPFWKQDSHWPTVEFSRTVELEKDETIRISVEGQFNFMLDGKLQFGQPSHFRLPAGKHQINIKVHNPQTPPALYISGETLVTDESWLATYEDKIWIDENGVSHGSGVYVPAACWKFASPKAGPSSFALSRRPMKPVARKCLKGTKDCVWDFGRETMGYLVLGNISGTGHIDIFYGESYEESVDADFCETLDRLKVSADSVCDLGHKVTRSRTDGRLDFVLPESKAFHFVRVKCSAGVSVGTVSMEYEYLPQNASTSGSFSCSDRRLDKIWQVAAYTMDLTTREFFMDGIKRDRWTWSGDAIQSYLMNYYLRFDTETVKRTIRQLRGKDPVTAHVNTIMDYTFYWFKSILDYYQFTGDLEFVREMYPRMRSLMEYCLKRTVAKEQASEKYAASDVTGLMEGQPDDWIFVDWVDFPMHKRGIMSFEQILFAKSLETMKVCACLLAEHPLANPPQGSLSTEDYRLDSKRFETLFAMVRERTDKVFWDENRQAYLHNVEDGRLNPMVTKFPNMMAMIFGYADESRCQAISREVMLNPEVEAITTPYMRFYELEALCEMGMQDHVLKEIRDYWGGMLDCGATSFWEKYNPSESGTQHLQMYGRPYGKSLCHAWGASPIYLLGRYFLGVKPLKPGYEEISIRPVLSGLNWMKGRVPTPYGPVCVTVDTEEIRVRIPAGKAFVFFHSSMEPSVSDGKLERIGEGEYRLTVEGSSEVSIRYQA